MICFGDKLEIDYFSTNLCVSCANEFNHKCDFFDLKMIFDIEKNSKKLFFATYKPSSNYFSKFNEKNYQDFLNFYMSEKKANEKICEKLFIFKNTLYISEDERKNHIIIFDKFKNPNQISSSLELIQAIKTYHEFFLTDFEKCFLLNDFSFEIIYELINFHYKALDIKKCNIKIFTNDFSNFLVDFLKNLNHDAFLYQPGLIYFIKYELNDTSLPLQMMCIKKFFSVLIFVY